jgi:ABC-type glycerol-3-phosphate transport system substrate-binding protein
MLYHKKVFDAAHLPYPKSGWTWDDFLKVAQKLSYREKNGIRHFAMASYDPMLMIYSNGGKMFTPNGTECIMNSPEAVSAMQFYRDLQNRYHVIPTASELSDQASAGGWGSGEINIFGAKGPKYFAMAYGGRFWYVQFAKMEREEPDGASLFDLGVVKAPIFKYDYTIGYGRCTGVNRNSKNREYALRFLEFLASPEFNRQINRSYDSLSGVQKYCEAPWTLSDNQPAPKGLESVNDPLWVTSMAYDYDYEESPFIPPYKVQQYWAEEFGKLSASNNESAKEMLDAFTKDVNDEIQRNVAFDPKLAQVYAVNKRKDEAGKYSE